MLKSFMGFRRALALTLGACLGLVGCGAGDDNNEGQAEVDANDNALMVQKCGQYDTVNLDGINVPKYAVVQNNRWGTNLQQCITVDSDLFGFTLSKLDPNMVGISGYPSIYRGCHWGNCTNKSGMPKQVSTIQYLWAGNTVFAPDHGSYNSAFDLWFNKTPTSSGQNNGAEIMVWTDKRSDGYNFQPVGGKIATAWLNQEGWDVWSGPLSQNGITWNVITYVRQKNPIFGRWYVVNYDMNQFVKDAESRHLVDGAWYLTSVQAGFEPRHNAEGLQSVHFSLLLQ